MIFCQPRTGSNLVQTELCSRWPEIRCLGEEYGPKLRGERPEETTEDITARVFAATDEHPVVGCRVFYEHVTEREFRDLLTVPGMKVVHLRRHNILRRYVSHQIALHNQVWARGRKQAAPAIDDRAVTVDVDDFIASSALAAERRKHLERALDDAGVAVLDVWYEDISADLDAQLRRIASFLNVGKPVSEPQPVHVRQNPEALRQLVRNYADVRSRLERTSMRELLDPEEAGQTAGRVGRRRQGRTCWPSEEQELLLQAALLPPEQAGEPFVQWQNVSNPDDVDEGSRRLYPLLHRNLRRGGVETPYDAVMWHAYVETSGRNQKLIRTLERVLGHLYDAGVPALVLKGAALTVLHYRDRGTRPMNDLDVMVPIELVDRALHVLRDEGWDPVRTDSSRPTAQLHLRHAVSLRQGDDEVDLHWHALSACMDADLDADFWDASVDLLVGGQRSRALAPTDQLLHAFVHGVRYNDFPPLRWIADAHVVINSSRSELDWDRLLLLSRRYRLAAYTSAALTYLDGLFPTIVPQSVLAAANSLPVSRQDRREFERMIRTSYWLPKQWYRYRRSEPDRNMLGAAFGFVDRLQMAYGLDHAYQLPLRVAAGMHRRMRHLADGTGDGRAD